MNREILSLSYKIRNERECAGLLSSWMPNEKGEAVQFINPSLAEARANNKQVFHVKCLSKGNLSSSQDRQVRLLRTRDQFHSDGLSLSVDMSF